VPGVGRKTAARLLIDLKSRLALPDLSEVGVPGGGEAASGRAEVRAALTQLGYAPDEIRGATDVLEDAPVPDMLRAALRELATR
jgi:Holliday junction DNA helicase RuvA